MPGSGDIGGGSCKLDFKVTNNSQKDWLFDDGNVTGDGRVKVTFYGRSLSDFQKQGNDVVIDISLVSKTKAINIKWW